MLSHWGSVETIIKIIKILTKTIPVSTVRLEQLIIEKWGIIFSHWVHLKLAHRSHALSKVCYDHDDIVPLMQGK